MEIAYPDSRPFPSVQNMELNTRLVDYPTGKAIERINLPNDGALPNASKTRIARTCSQVIELRCDQRRSRTRPRSSGTCFGAGVSASDHDNIVGAVAKLEGVQLHGSQGVGVMRTSGPQLPSQEIFYFETTIGAASRPAWVLLRNALHVVVKDKSLITSSDVEIKNPCKWLNYFATIAI